ncbi:MAG: SpoIIE family protein phosphatase [Desulfobacterales bacterium]|nr:SpoIIE family protein phosphatase [Desulfobacterales bacterium]
MEISETKHSEANILIIDDEPINLRILVNMLKTYGYKVRTARDGQTALSSIYTKPPDLILLDINMPEMDGYEVCRVLKKDEYMQNIPIIFISSLHEVLDKVQAFSVGGVDYIQKPFQSEEVLARVQTHICLKLTQQKLERQNIDLQREILERQKVEEILKETNEQLKSVLSQLSFRNRELEQEQEFAKNIFNNIINPSFINFANIKYLISPMSIFNGDLLLVTKNLSGGQYIIVGDFTGHGLKAAVGAIPVADTVYSMSKKGYTIEKIIAEINKKLHRILPTDVFFCCSFIELDYNNNKIKLWNGGMPDIVIYRHRTKTIRRIASKNLPLGIIDNSKLDTSIESVDIENNDQLFLFSDGLLESSNSQNEMFGYDNLEKCILNNSDHNLLFDEIQESVKLFRKDNAQCDDITLVEVSYNNDQDKISVTEDKPLTNESHKSTMHWKLVLELNAATLRIADPVPILMQLVIEKPEFEAYKGSIYTILMELITNSLDHGIMGLNSSLKQQPDGFDLYYNQRLKTLSTLEKGWLRIDMEHIPMYAGGKFTFKINDSGPGFDYREKLSRVTEDDDTSFFSGRGIKLVHSLCEKLIYKGNGNSVEAVYKWG